MTVIELINIGYRMYEVEELFLPFKNNLSYVEVAREEIGKGNDLAFKRDIPKGDAIHALIARNNNAILITLDHHFQKLLDIIKPYKPQDFL